MMETRPNQTLAHKFGRGVRSGAIGLGVAAAGWWSLLGWDHSGTYDSDGNYIGPYEPWQVIVLVVVLGILVVWLGIRGSLFVGPVAATVALTTCFAVEAHDDSSGLWAVGALLLAVGGYVSMTLGALVVHLVADARRRRAHRALGRPYRTLRPR